MIKKFQTYRIVDENYSLTPKGKKFAVVNKIFPAGKKKPLELSLLYDNEFSEKDKDRLLSHIADVGAEPTLEFIYHNEEWMVFVGILDKLVDNKNTPFIFEQNLELLTNKNIVSQSELEDVEL